MKQRKKRTEDIDQTEKININKDMEETIDENIEKNQEQDTEEDILEQENNNINKIKEKNTNTNTPKILSPQAKMWQEYLKKIGISPQAYLSRYPDHKAKEIIEELLNNKQ